MSGEQQITPILASWLLQPKLPPSAITLAGEIIAIDGQLMEYSSGMIAGSMDEISDRFESYVAVAHRIRTAIEEHSETHDHRRLIDGLLKVKSALLELV